MCCRVAPISRDLVAIPAIAMVTALGSFAIAWVVFARLLREPAPAPCHRRADRLQHLLQRHVPWAFRW